MRISFELYLHCALVLFGIQIKYRKMPVCAAGLPVFDGAALMPVQRGQARDLGLVVQGAIVGALLMADLADRRPARSPLECGPRRVRACGGYPGSAGAGTHHDGRPIWHVVQDAPEVPQIDLDLTAQP